MNGKDARGVGHSTSWYEWPFIAIGALSIVYHELWRGRRTATCQECGRMSHASADRCLCGAEVVENKHPEEFEGPDMAESARFDVLARIPAYSFIYHIASIVGAFAFFAVLVRSVPIDSAVPVLASFLVLALLAKLPNPNAVGNNERWEDVE